MKKILVTGGAGFIGSHTVVELSNNGYEPIIIDNFSNSDRDVIKGIQQILGKNIKVYEGDCCDLKFLNDVFTIENPDGVIHFAAFKAVGESVENPLKYYENNVSSLIALLKMMEKFQCNKFVFSSSCTVYGDPDSLPVNEQAQVKKAESPYGNTKQISEQIIFDYCIANSDFKAISLRYFNPIGAHSSSLIGELPLGVPNNLVPYITQTAIGQREELTVFGNDYNTPDGSCIRDFIHVVDLAKAHVSAINKIEETKQSGFYDIFNIGTGEGNSVLEVINTFIKETGIGLPYKIGPRRNGDVESVYADVSKANNELGWSAKLTLKDALKDSWEWQKKLEENGKY